MPSVRKVWISECPIAIGDLPTTDSHMLGIRAPKCYRYVRFARLVRTLACNHASHNGFVHRTPRVDRLRTMGALIGVGDES